MIAKKREFGMGLLSIALGLAVSTSLVVGGLSLFISVKKTQRVNQMLNEANLIHQVVEKMYANKIGYDGLTEGLVATSGLLPSSMVSGSKIVPSSRRNIDIYASTAPSCLSGRTDCADYYAIKFFNLDIDDCKRLVSSSPPGEVTRMAVGQDAENFVMPITDIEGMKDSCETLNAAGKSAVRWVYGLDPLYY